MERDQVDLLKSLANFFSLIVGNTFWSVFANLLWAGIAALSVHWWHRRRTRRLREKLARFEEERGRKEVALAIAARGEDIEAAVRNFLGQEIEVLKVIKNSSFGENEEEWLAFAREIRRRSTEIRQSGATRVHLFMNTPVAVGIFAGAILDGGPEVFVYHYFNGTYRRVGTLAHEAVVES